MGDRLEAVTATSGVMIGCKMHPIIGVLLAVGRVIQIRDVPEDIHGALVDAAGGQGLSLTKFLLRELEHLARRADVVQANAAVIRQTQAAVRGTADRETVLQALRAGRGE